MQVPLKKIVVRRIRRSLSNKGKTAHFLTVRRKKEEEASPGGERARAFMIRTPAARPNLTVGIVVRGSSTKYVPLLVDTGGSISLAGTKCTGVFHEKEIFPVTPITVETASGVMTLDHKWEGTLELGGKHLQVSLYLAPLYTGGIIFGDDVQSRDI